jgi:hypothetical protein
VGDDDAVYGVGEVAALGNEVEVGKATGIIVAHVHAAIEHDVLATQTHKNTTAPHILARPYTRAINRGLAILATVALVASFMKCKAHVLRVRTQWRYFDVHPDVIE